ncbi:MAG TPA: glycosyltransferase [Candidatus Eisenbacteria bacterium]|nr:glycosyltransferase [Candidatus Eisenbacteria bacterium]
METAATLNPPQPVPTGSTTRRVLILYVRAGVGHERAARAVAQAMRETDPHSEPILHDALDFSTWPLRLLYASSYNRMLAKTPRVWGALYRRAGTRPHGFRARSRTRVTMLFCKDFLGAVERYKPDSVLCTQFLPSEVYATLRDEGELKVPVYTVVTDFMIHPIWVYRGMDRYFVATQTTKDQLVDTGEVPPERVQVTGIPIDPKFAVPIAKEDARRQLGLDPDPSRPVVLVMSGGFGWGPVEQVLEVVLSLPDRVQAAVICGRNEGLRRRLSHRVRGLEDRIKISGFTDRVDLYMAAADVMVGKSGGLTMSEAMARGLPMIVFRPIPGQEERNCDFLQETGAGVRVHDYEELHYRLMSYVMHPEHLEVMRGAAARIGRPQSSHDVARTVLQER